LLAVLLLPTLLTTLLAAGLLTPRLLAVTAVTGLLTRLSVLPGLSLLTRLTGLPLLLTRLSVLPGLSLLTGLTRLTGPLTPTALRRRLLNPATLLGLLGTGLLPSPTAALPLLIPLLPRTPRPLWRRRHMRSFENPLVEDEN